MLVLDFQREFHPQKLNQSESTIQVRFVRDASSWSVRAGSPVWPLGCAQQQPKLLLAGARTLPGNLRGIRPLLHLYFIQVSDKVSY